VRIENQGAFLASCAGMPGRAAPQGRKIESARDFRACLLDEAKVAAVPGSAFAAAHFFRISCAASRQELREAPARIAAACPALAR